MVQKVAQFIQRDMWRIHAKRLPKPQSFFLRILRVFMLSLKEFDRDKCSLHASALTFFTLLSIVPIFAMAFGIAKGFGLENMLQERLMEFKGQQEAITRIIEFSQTMLQNTKGGVIAGVGVILLFWAVIGVLQNIEKSFNHIFAVQRERTLARKFADYLTIMMICPIMVILSGSLTVFVRTTLETIFNHAGQAGTMIGPYALKLLNLLPLVIFWLLLTFLYVVMPNTKVSRRSAFFGGLVAGSLYQLVQVLYIESQMFVGKLGAIYGSFAALPLFLTWLQLSWQIVLYGAEVAFAHQNEETYEFEEESRKCSDALNKNVELLMAASAVKRFTNAEAPLEIHDFAAQYEIPIRLARRAAEKLHRAGILSEIEDNNKETELYQPARNIDHLTVQFVLNAIEDEGADDLGMEMPEEYRKLKAAVTDLRAVAEKSPSNILLKNL